MQEPFPAQPTNQFDPSMPLMSSIPFQNSPYIQTDPESTTVPYQNQPISQQYVQAEPQSTNIPYQNEQITPQYVQAAPQSTTGRSRHNIPQAYHEYTLDDDYAYRRHHGHRPRHHYRPYDAYRSFEYTYGKSPGIFDDLKDISSQVNLFDNDYSARQRDWVEGGYHRHAHRRHHHRHHRLRRPKQSDYDDVLPLRTSGYEGHVTPGISDPNSYTDNSKGMNGDDKEAIMHLDFDSSSDRKDVVKDSSGNGNDASLMDGASITVKNLGSCGHGAVLKKGEISYKGEYFRRKPTEAVSIAMWVKSRNPGFIRWFDQDESPNKGFFASTKSASIGKNRWTHLAGTFDAKTGIARIYVNGRIKVEKRGKKNSGLPQDFTSTGIGRKFGDSHVSFLDDVYMFDRVLTAEAIMDLYKKCQFNRMVLHFGFQHWNGTTEILRDQSGLQNNASLKGGAKVRPKADCDKCGACLDLQSNPDSQVYLNSSKYHQKPTTAVSISVWVNLNRTKGLHSIFQAANDQTKQNLYNLEVIDGKIHWQSKDKNGDIIFDALTNEVTIPEGLWSHVTGTYSSRTGDAKIYVNGLLRAGFHNSDQPKLSKAWTKASIGGHFPNEKPFNGLLDEFIMYNWELDPTEVKFVSKYCADKPKLVSFTVKVPIL